MGVSKQILVALATLVVAAECFIPVFKRESPPSPPFRPEPGCHFEVATCVAPLQDNPLFNSGSPDLSTLLSNVDEVCSLFEQTERCIRRALDKCELHVRIQFEQTLSVGNFLCSARGRSLLRDVQPSVCVAQPLRAYELPLAVQYCIAESSQGGGDDYPDPCQQLAVSRQCTVQTAARECGDAAGVLASEVYDLLVPPFPFPCPEEGPHEYLKRRFELIRKRFIK